MALMTNVKTDMRKSLKYSQNKKIWMIRKLIFTNRLNQNVVVFFFSGARQVDFKVYIKTQVRKHRDKTKYEGQ